MLVLAIESSTSSAKAVLYDTEKGIVNSEQRVYGSEISCGGKTDPKAVFDLCMDIARKVAEGQDVEAIALCGIWHGICVCDRKMEPVTPAYSWDFTESSDLCRNIRNNREIQGKLYQRTGCMPHSIYPRHTLQYLASRGLDMKDKYFVTQGGFNFFHMTGEFLESISTQSGSGLLNLFTKKYDEYALDMAGVKENQFGQLATYHDVRPLSESTAKRIGIKAGIPVVPSHPDGALNQVGNYAHKPGVMTLSVGTSGALRVSTRNPILPKGNELWCYCGVENWISGAAISGACNCLNWFKEKFLCNMFSYAQLEEVQTKKENVPVFLPFLYGERCPGWDDERRGGFYYIEPDMSVQEFYYGLQQGILFNLYQCYQVLCQENGIPEKIYVSGGITNSSRWLQMLADIFKKEIYVAEYPNASAMGAVALAMYAGGELKNLCDFTEGAGCARLVSPKKANYSYYDVQYEKFLKVYNNK